jgi:cytochrome d ubiquinol oxidase subunit I
LQFAITTIYHFFIVPLSIGLAILTAVMETLYVRSGREVYKNMTKFWGKLFVINFAIGVATGIVQEFQFGMNWSEYSRFVGDIFGAPLAIEALLAFFLESVFIGVWIFGWDKLSKGAHAAVMWLVAIGTTVSAFWILLANSFMQEPVGYVLEGGRAVMNDFAALILNPNLWVQFPHVILASLTTASFFILGISAYHLVRKQSVDAFSRSFQIAAIIGAVSTLLVGLNGHSQGVHLTESQPMKMAAAEALWETEEPASFSILTIGDLEQRQDVFSIRIPRLLCLLTYNQLDCQVEGIYNLQAAFEEQFGPGDYIPPVGVVYWSFRIMVGAGFLMLGLAAYAVFLVMGDLVQGQKRILRLYTLAIGLPFIANTAGWIMAEVGRVPWIVYGLMRIENGVSVAVPGSTVLFSLIGFILIYSALLVANVYLLVKYSRKGIPEAGDPQELQENLTTPAPSIVGAQD